METTSGEEVFAFITAAAGTGNDHHMEVAQETENQPSQRDRPPRDWNEVRRL